MFKLLALWRKQAPFIDQKSTNGKQKGVKKFGQPPLPLIWTKSKRTAVFPQETFLKSLIAANGGSCDSCKKEAC